MEGYPDSGKPEDFTDDQLAALDAINEEDKTKLTKLQKAAIARWKFAKAKAAKEGGAAPAAAPAGEVAKPAAAAKPAAPKGPSAEEKLAEERRAKAAEQPVVKALQEAFGDAVVSFTTQGDFPCVVVKSSKWMTLLHHAKTELGFKFLNNLTAADYPPDRLEMVVQVQNLDTRATLGVKAVLPRDTATIESLTPVYAGANWLEREVFDMFGIKFDGHPDLRRLLLPDGWTGYPLRKDYDLTREQFIAMDEYGNDVVSFKEDEGW